MGEVACGLPEKWRSVGQADGRFVLVEPLGQRAQRAVLHLDVQRQHAVAAWPWRTRTTKADRNGKEYPDVNVHLLVDPVEQPADARGVRRPGSAP